MVHQFFAYFNQEQQRKQLWKNGIRQKIKRLGTKAETLGMMYEKLKTANLLPQSAFFIVAEWVQKRKRLSYASDY